LQPQAAATAFQLSGTAECPPTGSEVRCRLRRHGTRQAPSLPGMKVLTDLSGRDPRDTRCPRSAEQLTTTTTGTDPDTAVPTEPTAGWLVAGRYRLQLPLGRG